MADISPGFITVKIKQTNLTVWRVDLLSHGWQDISDHILEISTPSETGTTNTALAAGSYDLQWYLLGNPGGTLSMTLSSTGQPGVSKTFPNPAVTLLSNSTADGLTFTVG